MSLLTQLNNSQFIDYIRKNPNNLPPFVDASTKNKWLNLISIFHDKTILSELEKKPEWKDRVNLLSGMMSKIESQELEVIKKEYIECYNKYMKLYENSDMKPLRYLIYKYDFESEINDLFCNQRDNTSYQSAIFTTNVIFPGNPYLYVTSYNFYTKGEESGFIFMRDYKLECFLDCKINISNFLSYGTLINPAYGRFMTSKMDERDILYMIMKAYGEEEVYDYRFLEQDSDSDSE